jgi:uncharacterized membrane protein YfcA
VEFVIIPVVALLASLLTFFSGFGLGTILLSVSAIFFPVDVAVALTAVVHLLNSIFISSLKAKHISKNIILRFGLAAIPASLLGAYLLSHLAGLKPIFSYHISENSFTITPVKLVVAVMMLFFAAWEVVPRLRGASFGRKYLPLGGSLSGFFGGLSGLQGALRGAFLVRTGVPKESYVATNAAVAVMVDIPRISIYFTILSPLRSEVSPPLLLLSTLAAFLGVLLGNLWLKKVTMRLIQVLVSVLLFAIALALISGLI